jgi:NDP-sugar pyrophosphorylase family protein
VLLHSLENAAAGGAAEAVVVIGYRGEEVVAALGERAAGLAVRDVAQPEPAGVVDAMARARDALAGEDFLLFFADELLAGPRHPELVDRFQRERLFAVVGVVPESDPAQITKTFSVDSDPGTGLVRRLVEKPERPAPGVRGTGNGVFRHAILDYVARTPVHPRRGEREFPDLIQCAVDDGRPVRAAIVADAYVNVNTPDDFAAAQARFGGPDR